MLDNLYAVQPQKWTPPAYQKKAVKFLLEHAAAGLLLEPGLGKSSITLAAIKVLKARGLLSKVLIIAPLRVCHLVWPAERDKWIDFKGLKMVVLHGKHKDRLLQEEADIYVINPEGLDWLLQVEKIKTTNKAGVTKVRVVVDIKRWKKLGFDTLVVDELSKFKHTNTNRFKSLKLVVPTFARRWGLTGSPASNGLMDLFGQVYILDQGAAFGPFITHYRLKYFNLGRDGFTWSLKPGAEADIYKALSPLVLRMAATDYLDMPAVVENQIYVELPADAQEIYTRMEDDLLAKIEDRVIVAANAAVASGKCRQVASGGLYLTPEVQPILVKQKIKREWANIHTEKVEALVDLIEELQGQPLLVGYDFEHDLDRLRAALGKDVPVLGGGTSTVRAKELESLWNQGKLPVLLAHPQAMAHGLNLQEAGHHVCWHTLTWDFELYDQFIRRVLRQGNKAKTIFVHHILAKGTIDELVLQVLRSKAKGQQALFDALKDLSKRRRSRQK